MGFSLGGLTLLILGSLAQVKKPDFIVMLFVLSALFGASAAVILHFLGGRPIQPVIFMLPFLMIYVLRVPGAVEQIKLSFVRDRAVQYFLGFSVFALLVTIYAPIFLHGETLVYDVEDGKFVLRALEFGGSHIAQAMYLIGSFACFILVIGLSRLASGPKYFANAILALTALNAMVGILDLITFHLGYSEALMFLKNSGYAMVDQSMHGLRRISGTFSETSAFSKFSVGLLAFNLILYLNGFYRRYSGILSAITAILLILTTSSSAYLGLVGVALVITLMEQKRLKQARISKNVFFMICMTVFGSILLYSAFSSEVNQVFKSAVLEKLESESGVERMSWNQQAWMNFGETYFIGVGLGGNRTSSLLMTVISNVGIVGLFLFLMFLYFSIRGRKACEVKSGSTMAVASKAAAISMLIPALLGATSFYMGIMFYIFLALGCSAYGLRITGRES